MKHKRIIIFLLILFVAALMGYTISEHTMKTNLQVEKENIINNYKATLSIYEDVLEETKGVIVNDTKIFKRISNLNKKISETNIKNFNEIYDIQIEIYGRFFDFVQENKNIIFNEKSNKQYLFDKFRKRRNFFFIISSSYQEMLKDSD